MPPKKKLALRAKNGLKTSSSSGIIYGNKTSQNDLTEDSVLANSSTIKRINGSKISSFLSKSRKPNGGSFMSSQSSVDDLENDDGFFFKRSGKPVLNKTNILDSISESRPKSVGSGSVNDTEGTKTMPAKRSHTHPLTQDKPQKRQKKETPVRTSSRRPKPSAKAAKVKSSVIPTKSKSQLLDMGSESDIEEDLEHSFEPLVSSANTKGITNGKATVTSKSTAGDQISLTKAIGASSTKRKSKLNTLLSTSKEKIVKEAQMPNTGSQRKTLNKTSKAEGFVFDGMELSPVKKTSITRNTSVNTTKKSQPELKSRIKPASKTKVKPAAKGKPKQKTKAKKTEAQQLQDAGITADIPHELNLTSKANLPSTKVYGSPGKKEPLQIQESPVNYRNKQLRTKSNRRSSLGNRGKRTSSIGNGFEVTPHDDVLHQNFYKHLDQDSPEPHRMRQLLVWCFKRQLDHDKANYEKQKTKRQSNDDLIASNIAKVIKEELVRDLVDGKLNTSWWNRTDDSDNEEKWKESKKSKKQEKMAVKIVPNNHNIQNEKTLKLFEKRLAKLQKENNEWNDVSVATQLSLQNYKLEFNENEEEQIDILKEQIIKLENLNGKEKRKSRRKSKDTDYLESMYSSVIDNSVIDELQNKFKAITSEADENYEQTLNVFNNFVDKLSFNDSIIKNFEHNKRQHIAGIIRNYLGTNSIETTSNETDEHIQNTVASDENAAADNNDSSDASNPFQFDEIELLRGITKIDKP